MSSRPVLHADFRRRRERGGGPINATLLNSQIRITQNRPQIQTPPHHRQNKIILRTRSGNLNIFRIRAIILCYLSHLTYMVILIYTYDLFLYYLAINLFNAKERSKVWIICCTLRQALSDIILYFWRVLFWGGGLRRFQEWSIQVHIHVYQRY